jgi:hypothetical protein
VFSLKSAASVGRISFGNPGSGTINLGRSENLLHGVRGGGLPDEFSRMAQSGGGKFWMTRVLPEWLPETGCKANGWQLPDAQAVHTETASHQLGEDVVLLTSVASPEAAE